MRKTRNRLIKNRLLEILDGTPATRANEATSQRRGWRGQSLVEMAFLTPLLIILFAGLVEIGWLANTYLDLLDISRYGARRGATLSDDRGPLVWNNAWSIVPNANVTTQYEMDYVTGNATAEDFGRRLHREDWQNTAFNIENGVAPSEPLPPLTSIPNICSDPAIWSFYSDVICTMITSFDPVRFNPYNGVDDVIVSAFSLVLVDVEADPNNGGAGQWTMPGIGNRPIVIDAAQLIVAARYPTNTNECQAAQSGASAPTIYDPRDPFDMNGNNLIDRLDPPTPSTGYYDSNTFDEITGFDATVTTSSVNDNGTPGDPSDDYLNAASGIEKQVGFQWYGNHVIEGTGCIGSEFRIRDIEDQLNLTSYADETDDDARLRIPNTGVILVEIFYEHNMLLKFPVLSPVFEAFSRDGRPDLSIWAMFPLPSTEPYIEFIR